MVKNFLFLVSMLAVLRVPHEGWSHDPKSSVASRENQRREVRIPVRDFSLTDQNARRFEFRTIRGKVILLAFGYTTCPDVCPLTTAAMRTIQADFSAAERDAVFLLTVTTDPEVDKPEVLASYAKRYGADLSNWAFLTGEESSLTPVWKSFGVTVQRKARGLVDHTTLTAVIDREGVARFIYLGTAPEPKVMLGDLRRLLKRP